MMPSEVSDGELSPDLRTVERIIASAVIISNDGLFLLGKKRTGRNSSYEDMWHIFGGGLEPGETLEQAVVREVEEECGLIITVDQLKKLDSPEELSMGRRVKVLESGEEILDVMYFNRFEVRLNQEASNVYLPEDTEEFVEFRWFSSDELAGVNQIPGGREFFEFKGYIQS